MKRRIPLLYHFNRAEGGLNSFPRAEDGLNSFPRAEDGATAVEFAMIAPVLALVFMAIIEVSMMFFSAVNVDGAAVDAARRIRTGQSQLSADPATDFNTAFCNGLNSAITCADITYDVQTISNFASADLAIPLDEDGNPIPATFNAGTAGDIIVIRITYYWTFHTPMIANLFADNAGDNRRRMTSTVTFRNEPYS
ncbi:TadE/TadG family type IV pilus assembly protein [Pseudomonadota bacterium]